MATAKVICTITYNGEEFELTDYEQDNKHIKLIHNINRDTYRVEDVMDTLHSTKDPSEILKNMPKELIHKITPEENMILKGTYIHDMLLTSFVKWVIGDDEKNKTKELHKLLYDGYKELDAEYMKLDEESMKLNEESMKLDEKYTKLDEEYKKLRTKREKLDKIQKMLDSPKTTRRCTYTGYIFI